jgi:hypothetical protein
MRYLAKIEEHVLRVLMALLAAKQRLFSCVELQDHDSSLAGEEVRGFEG